MVSNSGEDDKYRIYGDTPHTGSVADCGAEIAVKVMCEEIGETCFCFLINAYGAHKMT